MATKTYVLLENMEANAPVFQQLPDGRRSQLKKIPWHRPTLRQTFQDENGVGVTIRYKAASKYIDQAKQIELEKLDANVPFTTTERRDCEFRYGVLVTNKLKAQEYVEAHPEFIDFKGFCDDVREPRYKLVDETLDIKTVNSDFKKRLQVGNKIANLELQDAKDLLIKLNGSHFATPDNLDECQNMLIAFMDDTNDAGLDAMLAEEINVDEKTTILIGNAINAKILSFNEVEGQVSKKQGDKWINVKAISSEYSPEERVRHFSEFLTTTDGKLLVADLEKDLKKNIKQTK